MVPQHQIYQVFAGKPNSLLSIGKRSIKNVQNCKFLVVKPKQSIRFELVVPESLCIFFFSIPTSTCPSSKLFNRGHSFHFLLYLLDSEVMWSPFGGHMMTRNLAGLCRIRSRVLWKYVPDVFIGLTQKCPENNPEEPGLLTHVFHTKARLPLWVFHRSNILWSKYSK